MFVSFLLPLPLLLLGLRSTIILFHIEYEDIIGNAMNNANFANYIINMQNNHRNMLTLPPYEKVYLTHFAGK
jgi:hypothetical protein